MEHTLLKEINKKTLQAYVNARVFDQFYFPTLFPITSTPFLTWETLTGDVGARIAADVVSYDSSAPLKARKVVSKMTGEIPPIRVKRVMKESDINTYNILKAKATPDQMALLNLVFGDVDFVMDAVMARAEWLALKALSYGSITLNKTVNPGGVVTENAIDYQIASSHKVGVGTAWADAANAKPITDIETVLALAQSEGKKIQYILMNPATWQRFRATAEVKDFVAPYAVYGGTRIKRAPGIEVTNEALQADGKPTIKIIDTVIGIENVNGQVSYENPWTDHYITYIPYERVGRLLHGPIAEETNPPQNVIQAKKEFVLVSKYSETDPVAEITKGEANAFPVIDAVDGIYIQKTNATTWS